MRRNEYMMKEIERQQLKDMNDEALDIQRQTALEDASFEEALESSLYWEVYKDEQAQLQCTQDTRYEDFDYWFDNDYLDCDFPDEYTDDYFDDDEDFYAGEYDEEEEDLADVISEFCEADIIESEIQKMEDYFSSLEYHAYLEKMYSDKEQEMASIQHSELSRKSKARIRHHNDEKAKKRAKLSALYLSSKLDKLSLNATAEEDSRLFARTIAAEKKAARLQ